MAVARFLLVSILLTAASQHRVESETVTGGLGEQLVGGCFAHHARQHADVPQRFPFIGHQDGLAHFQVQHRVEECHAQGQVILIRDRVGEGQGIQGTVAGAAAHVLDLLLIVVDVTIPHGLLAGVAIGAVQGVLAAGELGDRLVVIVQAVGGLILAGVKLHIRQAVITAVMACIALCVGHGGAELVHLGAILAWCRGMAGRAALPAGILHAIQR